MSDSQRSRALEVIQHRIEEHTQLLWKEVADPGIRELLAPLNLEPQQPVEKAFLFLVYGLILRECASGDLVRRHLTRLLELSHQTAGQREGMAVASGIASSSHLQEVWATLEHLGRTRVLRTACTSPDYQEPEADVHWRWVSSTSLLCYGHMAVHAGERILPWVDNVISRMVYYFSCGCYDNVLETSFVSAAVMLVKALKQEHSARRYRFTQIPELIQCLLAILQKEPNFLATLFRQKIILVIMELSKLRPSLKPVVKSRILQTCLQSLYELPPMEMLKSCLPPLDLAPDVMVTACSGRRSPVSGAGGRGLGAGGWGPEAGLACPALAAGENEGAQERGPWPSPAFTPTLPQPCLHSGKVCVLSSGGVWCPCGPLMFCGSDGTRVQKHSPEPPKCVQLPAAYPRAPAALTNTACDVRTGRPQSPPVRPSVTQLPACTTRCPPGVAETHVHPRATRQAGHKAMPRAPVHGSPARVLVSFQCAATGGLGDRVPQEPLFSRTLG
ncbi:Maestro heat-like repeat family member 5 [Vulpes lagopus]